MQIVYQKIQCGRNISIPHMRKDMLKKITRICFCDLFLSLPSEFYSIHFGLLCSILFRFLLKYAEAYV